MVNRHVSLRFYAMPSHRELWVLAIVIGITLLLILSYQVVSNRAPTTPDRNPKVPISQTFSVSFLEHGLLADSVWTVTFNGTTYVSASAGLTVYGVHEGTYTFVVGGVEGYVPSPSSGYVTVNGSDANQVIAFNPVGAASG